MIKEITEQQIKEALDLVNQVFLEFVAVDYSEQGRNIFEDYLKRKHEEIASDVRTGAKRIWGYYQEGKIIGVIARREITHISMLFVDKAYHRLGIARKLFHYFLREVEKQGEKIRITVNSSPYAVCVYERLGFTQAADRQERDGIIFIPMIYERCGLIRDEALVAAQFD